MVFENWEVMNNIFRDFRFCDSIANFRIIKNKLGFLLLLLLLI